MPAKPCLDRLSVAAQLRQSSELCRTTLVLIGSAKMLVLETEELLSERSTRRVVARPLL